MIDLSKKYYAVHVQADNDLNGIHYVPFTDEDIERMKKDYEETVRDSWFYDGLSLSDYMGRYLKKKFGYDIRRDNDFSVLIFADFEPVDMEAIIRNPVGEGGGSLFWYDADTPIFKE